MKDLDNMLEGLLDVDFDITDDDISSTVALSVLKNHKCRTENITWPGIFELLTVDGSNAPLISELGSNGLSVLMGPEVQKAVKAGDTVMIIYPRKPQQQAVEILYRDNGKLWAWPGCRHMSGTSFEGWKDFDEFVAYLENKSGANGWRRLNRVAKAINFGKLDGYAIKTQFETLIS